MTATETANPEDLELVRRAQAGDVAAFGELVERNRRAVFRAALAAVGSAAEADDVAQDAFVAAYQKLSGFRGEASFRTWLLAITWRKAIDRRTSMTNWMKRVVSPPPGETHNDEWDPMNRLEARGQSQEDDVMTSDLRRRLRPLIASLPKKLRDALLLAGSGDHSYEEIGQMLRIPVGTVKWRVSEARKVLKQKMAAMGTPMSADLDKAIDRAVREMLDVEPPADLRARVVARIEARPASFQFPVSSWVRFGVLAGAAAVLILTVTLARRSEPTAPAPIQAHGVDHVLPAPRPTAPLPIVRAAQTSVARRSAAIVVAASTDTSDAASAIDPLESITPIEVAPIAQRSITPEPIAVRPLNSIPEMQVAPLNPPDRRD